MAITGGFGKTRDPCRVKAFCLPGAASLTRERAATGSRRRSAVYTRIYTGLAALLLAALAACGGGGDDCDEERPKVRAEQPTEEPPCKGIPVDQLPAACGFPADGEQPTPPADCLGRREGCV
jgi:hypothetical protein